MTLNIKKPVDQEKGTGQHNEELEAEVEGHMRLSPASPDARQARQGPEARQDIER